MSKTTTTPAETEAAAIEEARAQAEAMDQGRRDAVNLLSPRGLLDFSNVTANLLAYFEAYDAELAERAADESISYATTEAYRRLLRHAQHPNGQAYRAELGKRAAAEAAAFRASELEVVEELAHEAQDELPAAILRAERAVNARTARVNKGKAGAADRVTVGTDDLRALIAAARR